MADHVGGQREDDEADRQVSEIVQPELLKGEWIDRDRQREEGANGTRIRTNDPDTSAVLDVALSGWSGSHGIAGFQYRKMC